MKKQTFNPLNDRDIPDPEVRKILFTIQQELERKNRKIGRFESSPMAIYNFSEVEISRLEKILDLFTLKLDNLAKYNNYSLVESYLQKKIKEQEREAFENTYFWENLEQLFSKSFDSKTSVQSQKK